MGSPFPGMDPFLEGDLWQEFHETLASAIRAQLLPKLGPKYVALLAKRYVMGRSTIGITDTPSARVIYPDVNVSRIREVADATYSVALAEPTIEIESEMSEQVPVLSVEVRDIAERRLVTAIEILSPANKFAPGYAEYLAKREALLQTHTHLLEIDLLRRGERIALRQPLPSAPYYVFLSRFQRRPLTAVWALPLRERLKVVPVPLLPPDPDVALDLQAAVDACFALVGYERLIDYAAAPPLPALEPEDTDWVAERLRAVEGQAGDRRETVDYRL